jgi:hypothetical protein
MLEPELKVMGASGGVYALLISQLANILLVSKYTSKSDMALTL